MREKRLETKVIPYTLYRAVGLRCARLACLRAILTVLPDSGWRKGCASASGARASSRDGTGSVAGKKPASGPRGSPSSSAMSRSRLTCDASSFICERGERFEPPRSADDPTPENRHSKSRAASRARLAGKRGAPHRVPWVCCGVHAACGGSSRLRGVNLSQ